ncbi:MAG: WbqC family protein [Planctomycetes bacterium]|nr:WbqC family protein [Planctomycetota bacterium]
MLITGHQPNYLPYLGFFHKILISDAFVIVDNVQFVKRGPFGWIHRNKIRTKDGEQWLSVPILTSGKFDQMIMDCAIDKKQARWNEKQLKAIEINYRKAPHFEKYIEKFREVLTKDWDMFLGLSVAMIEVFLEALEVKIPVYKCSELEASGKGKELILAMCEKLGADRYLSGIHGKDYLGDLSYFTEKGVAIEFQDFRHPEYPQCQPGKFLPYMSSLDALFNLGSDLKPLLLASGGIETPGSEAPREPNDSEPGPEF